MQPSPKTPDYDKAKRAVEIIKSELTTRGETGNLFCLEQDHQLQGILGNISQAFDGKDLYPSTVEEAACLLYFIIKTPTGTSGLALLFLLCMSENGLLEKSGIKQTGLVTLALLPRVSRGRRVLLICFSLEFAVPEGLLL